MATECFCVCQICGVPFNIGRFRARSELDDGKGIRIDSGLKIVLAR
jgi:hypothetical protein